MTENPFTYTTPEDLTAEKTVDLFVDIFSDFNKVNLPGHVFVHGPRGSGKSMIFRYLQPDCQCLANKCDLKGIPFYSIYFPIKNTDLKLTEFERLEGKHASPILNEHFMTLSITHAAFIYLRDKCEFKNTDISCLDSIKNFAEQSFFKLIKDCGWNSTEPNPFSKCSTLHEYLDRIVNICDELFKHFIRYLKKLSFLTTTLPYDGPLCGFLDFLYPLLCDLKKLKFMPRGPIFLLMDDADNLNLTQTTILNSWVASRTSSNVSIKISTQYEYKSYRTATGHIISAPHDFSEINISAVYTASYKSTYKRRIKEIISRRLKLSKIDATPEQFFPNDQKQELAINKIAEDYLQEWSQKGRGYRASDDAVRYARPDYMKRLAGSHKSGHTYSYSGFDQLVHISSGVVRYFIEAASQMYSEKQAINKGKPVEFIPSNIQDSVVRRQADEFMLNEFDKLLKEKNLKNNKRDVVVKLYNLIKALGGTFREILLSDRAERRVFSVAFSDDPDEEIREVINKGIHLGYFHESAIGNKEGTGRTPLYVLTRRLAPSFKLDPTSFAGYLFVTNAAIRDAIDNPRAILRKIQKKDGVENVFERPRQLKLFK